ncbi:hypothetical protein GW17_00036910 [Ensete ventricosum]|nr:hypothetical protein GW17_00036910 [Ensete ventricosum]RZR95236.1 hypothetical protein BHM03_00024090 [Ensete ventricosum]
MEYLCRGTSSNPSNPSNVLQLPKWVYSTTHPSNGACAVITMLHKRCVPLLQTWSFVLAHQMKLLQLRCDEYHSAESSIATAPSDSPRRKE